MSNSPVSNNNELNQLGIEQVNESKYPGQLLYFKNRRINNLNT